MKSRDIPGLVDVQVRRHDTAGICRLLRRTQQDDEYSGQRSVVEKGIQAIVDTWAEFALKMLDKFRGEESVILGLDVKFIGGSLFQVSTSDGDRILAKPHAARTIASEYVRNHQR